MDLIGQSQKIPPATALEICHKISQFLELSARITPARAFFGISERARLSLTVEETSGPTYDKRLIKRENFDGQQGGGIGMSGQI